MSTKLVSNQTVYKIRRRQDGKFSTGGTRPRFTKTGRTWNGIGPLKRHVQVVTRGEFNARFLRFNPYADCEIVTYELRLVNLGTIEFEDLEQA